MIGERGRKADAMRLGGAMVSNPKELAYGG